ncbi:HRAS-like suppressor 2 [Channa argus]|uniref:HRAS-like suppressor 2 n=2 Tax=Channa argus TaxID=215402 RepID=A0A6G1PPT8_CHAAH|nr:HRAS-like suppressor 2 [Channa argus]
MVLVAVILLLAATGINSEYSFGDIISFERSCPCMSTLTYKHFAIYVGNKEIDGKESGKDIYQRTGPVFAINPLQLSDCIFSKLEDERQPSIFGAKNVEKKDNYLDGFEMFTAGPEDKIIERIQETKGNCNTYNPISNNCEHLATYIRYGVRVSLQLNTSGENLCKNNPLICPILTDIKAALQNEAQCHKCVQSSKFEG